MARNDKPLDSRVKLDLNNPEFQQSLFALAFRDGAFMRLLLVNERQ